MAKAPRDINQLAKHIVDRATGEVSDPASTENPKATAGKKGGLKGGANRAKKLTAKERSEIAKKAAEKRWAAVKKAQKQC